MKKTKTSRQDGGCLSPQVWSGCRGGQNAMLSGAQQPSHLPAKPGRKRRAQPWQSALASATIGVGAENVLVPEMSTEVGSDPGGLRGSGEMLSAGCFFHRAEAAAATCSGFRVFFSALLLAKADPVGAPAEALRLSKVDFTFVAAFES